MRKTIKKWDKNLNKFIKIEVEESNILEKNSTVLNENLLNKKENNTNLYKQEVFINSLDIKIINSLKDYIDNFDYNFFDKHKKDINIKMFKEKLYTLERKITKYLFVKKRKDNKLIEEAISEFKKELKGYRQLKEAIMPKLSIYKIDKFKKRRNSYKNYKSKMPERVSRFGHESYGCVLSISKGRRGSF